MAACGQTMANVALTRPICTSLASCHELACSPPPAATISLLETLMTACLVSLARAHGTTAAFDNEIEERDRLRMEQLQELIGAHFREHRPASFYAERLSLSAAHLNRICRRTTGASLQQMVARRLIDAAAGELVFSQVRCSDIAYGLGFATRPILSRFFR